MFYSILSKSLQSLNCFIDNKGNFYINDPLYRLFLSGVPKAERLDGIITKNQSLVMKNNVSKKDALNLSILFLPLRQYINV